MLPPERRRLVEKLVRELMRVEHHAIENETCRTGDTPPALALDEIARHAAAMRGRMLAMLDGHGLVPSRRFREALTALRTRVVDHCIAGEHAYRSALLEQRHALEVAAMLRSTARADHLFGLIRWCDDWIAARRTLVSRVEAQLCWFAREPAPRTPVTPPLTDKPRRDGPSST
jgi:hypothetical protein